MNRFWDLLAQSIIVQALVTLISVLTVSYMYIAGMQVPQELVNIVMLILGFWFGTKAQNVINARGK